MKPIWLMGGLLLLTALALWRPAAPPAAPVLTEGRLPQTPAPRSPQRKRAYSEPLAETVVVYVAGAVVRPGLYSVPAASRIDEAVRRAGGFAQGADPAGVNLALHPQDGDEIRVPLLGEATRAPNAHRRKGRKGRKPRESARSSIQPVDLNSADAPALASLPGIGAGLATRIVAYRQLNGPFASIDELADVSGMTQRRIDALAPYLVLHEAR